LTQTTIHSTGEARRELERDLESYRVELRAYCYRMLGSAFDAEDAVQDTLLRAWRHLDTFEGRSSMRSWLYRIATNVSLDVISRRGRRARPADLGGPGSPDRPLAPPLTEQMWVEPMASAWVVAAAADPSDRAVARESVRMAFVAALQMLPPRQRAVLILREVLAWRPSEIATLLDTTVASVNSALQRARQTMSTIDTGQRSATLDAVPHDLLRRYVDAFERYDVDVLVSLLHEDATWTMPPHGTWFSGRADIRTWLELKPCGGSLRLAPFDANGTAGFITYQRTPTPGVWEAFGVMVLDVRDDAIAGVDTFLDAGLVALFGQPPTITA
jgi:RNA polymerase sigma-70 factor (ECF subfamily)